MTQSGSRTGMPGLMSPEQMVTAAPGFRSLRVARIDRESSSVVSLLLEPIDARPLTVPLPGQFVAVRLRPKADAPPVLRSYSLSDRPEADHYRITIKEEPHGIASTYLSTAASNRRRAGRQRAARRLQLRRRRSSSGAVERGRWRDPGDGHAPRAGSARVAAPGLVDYGARNRPDHPFAREARDLLAKLPHARSYVQYSRPDTTDRLGFDFDAVGRLTVTVLEELGVPRESDFYLCGPPAFLEDFTAGLDGWGVAGDRVHTEIFGSGKSITPGVAKAPRPHRTRLRGRRRRSKNFICSRRPHGLLGLQVPEPVGARRSLRRPGALVLPDRSLPYLRVRVDFRVGEV